MNRDIRAQEIRVQEIQVQDIRAQDVPMQDIRVPHPFRRTCGKGGTNNSSELIAFALVFLVCHSRRESAFALAFALAVVVALVFLSVIPKGNLQFVADFRT